jgi:hypothetical protein
MSLFYTWFDTLSGTLHAHKSALSQLSHHSSASLFSQDDILFSSPCLIPDVWITKADQHYMFQEFKVVYFNGHCHGAMHKHVTKEGDIFGAEILLFLVVIHAGDERIRSIF